jgi:signal peptidase II
LTTKAKIVGAILTCTIVLDQVSKVVIDRFLPLHATIPVIENLLNLTYIRNKGAAFGMMADSHAAFRLSFLILFSLLAITFLIVVLRRLPQTEKGLVVSLALILGGAIGNLIDRFLYGEVIDFIDFYWSDFHWPAFNCADSFITIGVTITLYRLVTAKGVDPFAFEKS